MLGGFLAVLYIAALWYGADAFARDGSSVAERLRLAIGAGIALPAVLALLGVFYVPLLWCIIVALCAYRLWSRRSVVRNTATVEYAVLCVAVALAWPVLCRPLLDGDSLLYHLPNAVAFVQTHTIWQSSAPYSAYPPASELFASGIFAVSGRWALPLAGLMPALLLTARLYELARAAGASAIAAAATPLAFVVMPVAAFQIGTLQNDLWLAAFILEIASSAGGSPIAIAVATLLKPFGWLEAAITALFFRAPLRSVILGFVPLVVWMLRYIIVAYSLHAVSFSTPAYWPSTIAGNLYPALLQLAHGIAAVTPQAFLWLVALAAGFAFRGMRRYAALGTTLLVLYAFIPLTYKAGNVNYVLDASSFRFALPALACGAACSAIFVSRAERVIAPLLFALTAWGTASTLAVYWNDAYTRWMPVVAILVAVCAVAMQRLRFNIGPAYAVIAAIMVIAGSSFAQARHAGFYADWMRDAQGHPTAVFSWLEQHQPARIIAQNIRIGAIEMNSPSSRVNAETQWSDACQHARQSHAVLFVGTNEDVHGVDLAILLLGAHHCGTTLFQDGAALIVAPS